MSGGGVSRLPSTRSSTPPSGSLRAARIVVAVALTAYVLWQANPSAVVHATSSADWKWLGAALALVLVDRALMAYRWMVLLCALAPGTRPPFSAVLRIFFISTFVGSFLPSLGGDAYRAYSLSRLHVRGVESAASVIMDRALGVLSMVLLAIGALLFARQSVQVPGVVPIIAVATAGCAAAAAALYSEGAARLALRAAALLPGDRARSLGADLVDAVRRYSRHHAELTNVLLSSVGVQVIRVLQAYCLGVAIGISAPLAAYFVFVPLILLVMQVPITISGLGTSQLMFDFLFSQIGVPSAQAVALSILFVALGVAGNLPGAILYVTGGVKPEPRTGAAL